MENLLTHLRQYHLPPVTEAHEGEVSASYFQWRLGSRNRDPLLWDLLTKVKAVGGSPKELTAYRESTLMLFLRMGLPLEAIPAHVLALPPSRPLVLEDLFTWEELESLVVQEPESVARAGLIFAHSGFSAFSRWEEQLLLEGTWRDAREPLIQGLWATRDERRSLWESNLAHGHMAGAGGWDLSFYSMNCELDQETKGEPFPSSYSRNWAHYSFVSGALITAGGSDPEALIHARWNILRRLP